MEMRVSKLKEKILRLILYQTNFVICHLFGFYFTNKISNLNSTHNANYFTFQFIGSRNRQNLTGEF